MVNRLYFHFAAQVLNAFGLVAAFILWARALENPVAIDWTWRFVMAAFVINMLIGMANFCLALRDIADRSNTKSVG